VIPITLPSATTDIKCNIHNVRIEMNRVKGRFRLKGRGERECTAEWGFRVCTLSDARSLSSSPEWHGQNLLDDL
jgi:hypothetical protein